MNRIVFRAPLGALLALCANPALADHMGPSGLGSGRGMSVFSPDTLDAGHWATGVRFTYTRPERRSDEELEALAEEGIGAHNTDYNLNASVGAGLWRQSSCDHQRRDALRPPRRFARRGGERSSPWAAFRGSAT